MGNMCLTVADSCWYMEIRYCIVKNKIKFKKRKKRNITEEIEDIFCSI